jgi:predicted enzyme related to lactoylglutathione lyase
MIQIRPRETVILASDFVALYSWYRDVLGFRISRLFEGGYHYCNLETATGIAIGIGDAKEMGVQPGDRAQSCVLMQIEVDDVRAFFAHVEAKGGSVRFGPSLDEKDGFWYGGIADPEGNPIWVVDSLCP